MSIHITPESMPKNMRKVYECSGYLKTIYAQKCQADLLLKTAKTFHNTGWQSPERLEMYDLFDKYDRILYVDADVFIKPNAPNIFETFKEDEMYMLNECPLGERNYNTNMAYIEQTVFPCIKEIRPVFDPPKGYPYFNAGVMLCPKKYRHIVQMRQQDYFEHHRMEQDYINYNMWAYNIEVRQLPIEWNGIHLFQKDKENYIDKLHFIHYIGPPRETVADMMLADFEKITGMKV